MKIEKWLKHEENFWKYSITYFIWDDEKLSKLIVCATNEYLKWPPAKKFNFEEYLDEQIEEYKKFWDRIFNRKTHYEIKSLKLTDDNLRKLLQYLDNK